MGTVAGLAGAGFNPVRGLTPDVLARAYPAVWIYIAGPVIGALAFLLQAGIASVAHA